MLGWSSAVAPKWFAIFTLLLGGLAFLFSWLEYHGFLWRGNPSAPLGAVLVGISHKVIPNASSPLIWPVGGQMTYLRHVRPSVLGIWILSRI